MVDIIPDILEKDQQEFRIKLQETIKASKRVHVDIIEQAYVDNQTLFPEDWGEMPKDLEVETHLMVVYPEDWIDRCIKCGSTIIVSQLERVKNQQEFVKKILDKGIKVGLAVDLDSDIFKIDQQVYSQLSVVLLMGVKAGYSGQKFSEEVLSKIPQLRQNYGDTAEIQVDGGINLETAKVCVAAGCDALDVNSYLWQDFKKNLAKLKRLSSKKK